jgi:hypothetical protein
MAVIAGTVALEASAQQHPGSDAALERHRLASPGALRRFDHGDAAVVKRHRLAKEATRCEEFYGY